ncbi:MAG: FkbM family methyltransferase [Bryobacterales bacterium]|nr:FkbM family methyltransferase [Bryobacterales bacterium]
MLFLFGPVALLAAVWGLTAYPKAFLILLWASGRTGECPFERVLEVASQTELLNQTTAALAAGSQVVESADGLERWRTPHGDFWAPKETHVAFLLAEQVTRVYGDGERRVRSGDIVLDCGANIGAFTWEALRAGAAKVVAIEPSERNIECLRRSFRAEIDAGRVVVYPKGVWRETTELVFHEYDNSALDSFVMEERKEDRGNKVREIRVPVTTIDTIRAELGLDRVDFIKMDIEGAERHALAGAAETLSRDRPRLAIAAENLDDDQRVIGPAVMSAWSGYTMECGRCWAPNPVTVRPDVFYFF